MLVTTLTKKMAEDLTDYLENTPASRCAICTTMSRPSSGMELIRDLRLGVYDVLVGINLLREGLDIPEVSLVAILDADKEGFLRSETSLIQTIGRAARNARRHGRTVCRQHHALDEARDGRDRAPPRACRRRINKAARHHPQDCAEKGAGCHRDHLECRRRAAKKKLRSKGEKQQRDRPPDTPDEGGREDARV